MSSMLENNKYWSNIDPETVKLYTIKNDKGYINHKVTCENQGDEPLEIILAPFALGQNKLGLEGNLGEKNSASKQLVVDRLDAQYKYSVTTGGIGKNREFTQEILEIFPNAAADQVDCLQRLNTIAEVILRQSLAEKHEESKAARERAYNDAVKERFTFHKTAKTEGIEKAKDVLELAEKDEDERTAIEDIQARIFVHGRRRYFLDLSQKDTFGESMYDLDNNNLWKDSDTNEEHKYQPTLWFQRRVYNFRKGVSKDIAKSKLKNATELPSRRENLGEISQNTDGVVWSQLPEFKWGNQTWGRPQFKCEKTGRTVDDLSITPIDGKNAMVSPVVGIRPFFDKKSDKYGVLLEVTRIIYIWDTRDKEVRVVQETSSMPGLKVPISFISGSASSTKRTERPEEVSGDGKRVKADDSQ